MGVSVEDADAVTRVDDLRTIPAAVKFLSCEPLIGDLGRLDLTGIDWVIVGGESGPRARPMDPRWVEAIRDQCASDTVPFFFKQWGGRTPKQNGRHLDGRLWDELPTTRVV
jgi:protein gp37